MLLLEKVTVLKGNPGCPDLIAVSVCDTKPVHFLSMSSESIKWVKKNKQHVYCIDTGKMEEMEFLQLNLNDDFNQDMCHVDRGDQLRNVYRFDHWMRKVKWWWLIWFWGMGVLMVNSYVEYLNYMLEQGIDRKAILSHYEFQKDIALAWIDPDTFWPDKYQSKGKQHLSNCASK